MKASIAQWIGSRDKQEDAYRVKFYPDGLLVLVADGGSGSSCGEFNSTGVINFFEAEFTALGDCSLVPERLSRAFVATVQGAASSSLLAVFISGSTIFWLCRGESLLLLWRQGELQHLNAAQVQGACSLIPGDCILVASDGLAGLLTAGKVSDVLRAMSAEIVASPSVCLVQACHEFAEESADNVTVVSVSCP